MINVVIKRNGFDKVAGYSVSGKAKPAVNNAVYAIARATFYALEHFMSAEIMTDEKERFEVTDIRVNKQAQAVCAVLLKGVQKYALEYPNEVRINWF